MLLKSRSHCLVRHKDGRQCRAAEGQDRVRQGQDLQSSAKLRCKAWGFGSVYSVCRLLASKTVMAMANARQTAAQKADAPTMPQPRSHWSHCRRRGPMIMISSSRFALALASLASLASLSLVARAGHEGSSLQLRRREASRIRQRQRMAQIPVCPSSPSSPSRLRTVLAEEHINEPVWSRAEDLAVLQLAKDLAFSAKEQKHMGVDPAKEATNNHGRSNNLCLLVLQKLQKTKVYLQADGSCWNG